MEMKVYVFRMYENYADGATVIVASSEEQAFALFSDEHTGKTPYVDLETLKAAVKQSGEICTFPYYLAQSVSISPGVVSRIECAE